MAKIKINFIYYLLFIVLVIVAVITPHIFHEYGRISENSVQSIIIFFDIALGGIIYSYYQRRLEKMSQENQACQMRLIESYKYVGKVHTEMELLHKFMSNLKRLPGNDAESKKQIFTSYLTFMLVSVAKVNKGMLRFIDLKKGRTLKDFTYCRDNKFLSVKLSNSEIINGELSKAPDRNYIAVKSDYEIGGLKCVITFPKTYHELDLRLLKILLNQTHLIFVTFNRGIQNA